MLKVALVRRVARRGPFAFYGRPLFSCRWPFPPLSDRALTRAIRGAFGFGLLFYRDPLSDSLEN